MSGISPFGDLAAITPRVLADGVVTRILHGQKMSFVYIELDPGAPVAEHAHRNEQIGILLSGSIDFRVGGELRTQHAGETWTIPPHVPHGIDRTGPEGATLVEAFTPARQDWGRLEQLDPRPLRSTTRGATTS